MNIYMYNAPRKYIKTPVFKKSKTGSSNPKPLRLSEERASMMRFCQDGLGWNYFHQSELDGPKIKLSSTMVYRLLEPFFNVRRRKVPSFTWSAVLMGLLGFEKCSYTVLPGR